MSTAPVRLIVTTGPGPPGESREAFRQPPPGPDDDPELASYLRIEERELEAGGQS